ncbi:MAG: hypothetical protein RH946_03710 [Rhodospirillales bacterium]
MSYHDPVVTINALADGIVSLNDTTKEWSIVKQDRLMPQRLRRALAMLSSICLEDGVADLGSCIHDVLAMATTPVSDWGIPILADAKFEYRDTILVDGELGVPTDDCIALANVGGEVETLQNMQHNRLRSAVATLGTKRKADAYTVIREFVVRNPVVSVAKLKEFVSSGGRAAIANDIERFYEDVPVAAVWSDGEIKICDGCGGLLWPEKDLVSYPNGRCHLKQCIEENPTPNLRASLSEPSIFRTAERSVSAFWVGPGLDEVRIYDALTAAGVPVVLYPYEDQTDVGTKDLKIGIDAKSYASPLVLGRKLSESVGGLQAFAEKYLVVPDAKTKKNPDYVKQLKDSYTGGVQGINFMTTSETIVAVTAKHGTGA